LKKKYPLVPTAFFLLCLAAGTLIYWNYGHAIVKAIYERKSGSFLNRIIQGQASNPLQVYLESADGMFFASVLLLFAALFIFMASNSKKPDSGGQWIFSGLIIFGMVAVAFFRPSLMENEWLYMVNPRRIAHPEFLAHDWTWQQGTRGYFVFDWLVSPFAFFLSSLKLVLLGRALVWILLIVAFLKSARTLGLKWWQAALGFAFWFYAGQSFPEWEWVFGGFEAKCLSYFFLFLALHGVLNHQEIRAGIYAGISASFHGLIGGWGSLALSGTMLVPFRCKNPNRFLKFFSMFFFFALPGFIPGLLPFFKNFSIFKDDYTAQLLFRATHAPFLSIATVAEIVLLAAGTLILLGISFDREYARKLRIFLIILTGFFALGLLGKAWNRAFFLSAYPCRLGPVFLLLFFSLSVFRFLGRSVFVSFLLLSALLYCRMPEKLFKHTAYFGVDWKKALKDYPENDFSQLAGWVKTNTALDSVFVAPPWEYRFALSAERSQVVCYKYEIMDVSIQEWMRRLADLNGGKALQYKQGLSALRENYSRLTPAQLEAIKLKYGARYYLVPKERPDLPFRLVYSNSLYFLYDLDIPNGPL